jgi:phosphoglycolate phosphatase
MIKYDCFIFDFDGTLADSRLNITNSFNRALKLYNLKPISPELIYPLIGKLNIEETFKKFYPYFSLEKIKKLTKSFKIYQRKNSLKEIFLFDGVFETLKTLQKKRKKLVILTTKQIDQIIYILNRFKIKSFFDIIIGEGFLEFKKPQKECFDYINKNIKKTIPKSNFVMIGDSIVDCQFAYNSEIDMIGVSWGIDNPSVLKKSGAKYIINNISELIKFS